MNRILKISSLLPLVFFALTIFVSDTNAQCVSCTPAPPGGWVCTPSTMGGNGCTTDGGSCTVHGPCVPENGLAGGKSCVPKLLDAAMIEVSDSLIRDVARYDARAALALINIRNIKAEFSVGRVSFAPIDFNETDVESQLTMTRDSEYFKVLNENIKKAFAKKLEPVVYEFVVSRNDDTGATLQIKPANLKDSKSPVEIILSKITGDSAKSETARFEGSSWKTK